MKNILLYSIFLFIMILMSCEDQFSQVVEFDLPEHEPKIVAYCFVAQKDSLLLVELTKSTSALDDNIPKLEESTISIYKDNELYIGSFKYEKLFVRINERHYGMDSIKRDSVFDYFYTAVIPSDFESNRAYRLEVASPGLTSVTSEVFFPEQVKIEKAEYSKNTGKDIDGYTFDEVVIDFTDPAGDNYYLIAATSVDVEGMKRVSLFTDDFRIKSGYEKQTIGSDLVIENGYVYFSDKEGFTSKSNTIKLEINSYGGSSGGSKDFIVYLYSISKDLFHFIETNNLYRESQDSPFVEPVAIFNNIDNGFGMFSITNYDKVLVEVK